MSVRLGWWGAADPRPSVVVCSWMGAMFRGPPAQTQWRVDACRVPAPLLGEKNTTLTGVTRDAGGTALGNCRVELFKTGTDVPIATTTSDGSGNFTFTNPGSGPFYLVAYLAGSPDRAGSSANTLLAT